MGKTTGFLEFERGESGKRSVDERLGDYREFVHRLPIAKQKEQAARCMNCGIPFCHSGCPLGNLIPDWNDEIYRDRPERALQSLLATNNFPEITGRVCPAPCEEACVLNIEETPVTIKTIEREIAERALEAGTLMAAHPIGRRTGRSTVVVGSGPAGLACAQELVRAGHDVTVLERDDRLGGLLRYGIPDFKLEKNLVDARVAQMTEEGVRFETRVSVGSDVLLDALQRDYDAVVLALGASKARDLNVEGRRLPGVHFAMEFLTQQNRVVAGDEVPDQILATGKDVVILGGGDTGSDCLGTSLRQGARNVTQIELLAQPPDARADSSVAWPDWPLILRTSSSQEEGGERRWAVLTDAFVGGDGLQGLRAVELEWEETNGQPSYRRRSGSEMTIDAQLCLLAMGFTGVEGEHWLEAGGVQVAPNGRIVADESTFATSQQGVFACGDSRRGQSLVVWAIWEGRQAARAVDRYLGQISASYGAAASVSR